MDIFINYRSDDEACAAVLLDEKLCERFGDDRVFRDSRSIGLGLDFKPVLWGGLAKSSVFIVVIGERWLARDGEGRRRIDDPDDFIRREIALALRIDIRVIPVLVGNVPTLRSDQLPADIEALAHRQYLRLNGRGAQHDIARLVDEIAEILAGTGCPPAGRAARVDEPVRASGGGPTGSVPKTGRGRQARRGTVAMLRIADTDRWAPPAVWQARHDAVLAAITKAVARAGLSGADVGDQDPGFVVFVPVSVPPIRVVAALPRTIEAVLAEEPPVTGGQPGIKLGIQYGTVGGDLADVLDELAYLLALPVLDTVLQRAMRSRTVLVIPDDFYGDVVRQDPRAIDPSTFLCTASGGDGGRCWIQVPNYPAPPGVVPVAEPRTAAERYRSDHGHGPAAQAVHWGTSFDNRGAVTGDQYGGDHVEGNKNVYGDGRWRP